MGNFVEGFWETNLGDDLFLKILCERYAKEKFYIISRDSQKVFQGINNLKRYPRGDEFGLQAIGALIWLASLKIVQKISVKNKSFSQLVMKLIPRIELHIIIGGSIFMCPKDEHDLNKTEYFSDKKIGVNLAKHTFVLGANFGPYYFSEQVEQYARLFEKIDDVCFRDQYSRSLFPDSSNIRFATDIVMSLDTEKYNHEKNEKILVISVVNMEEKGDIDSSVFSKNQEEYESKLAEIANKYISEEKGKVILMSFCDAQKDYLASNRIFNKLKDVEENVSLFSHSNIDESLMLIAKADKILATRFHGMILGWRFKKPTMVVSYSEKTIQVIESSNPEQKFVKFEDVGRIDSDSYKDYFTEISSSTQEALIEDAIKQFWGLDLYFQKKSNFER
ncbi:MAG: polysaccharide pyruvyl transferase family protein [Streptococcaceae bacterium]|nr:polysaccharide pyruvyl transferase family protein [Streptococcaceae bacterium]